LLDGLDRDQRHRRAQGDDGVDALVLLELVRHAGEHRRVVGAVDVQLAHGPLGAEALLHPGAPGLELDLALGLQDAQHVLGARRGRCWAPAAARRWPAARPAMLSSWPKYSIPPHCCQLLTPALNMTTGIPAATAFLIVGQMAAGAGSVTAMPLTLLLIASWISVACLVGSSSLE